jgi:hypothetical protein
MFGSNEGLGDEYEFLKLWEFEVKALNSEILPVKQAETGKPPSSPFIS